MSDAPKQSRDASANAALEVSRTPVADDSPRVVCSDALLAGKSQLAILHKQSVYFLRQTRFGKLILTK